MADLRALRESAGLTVEVAARRVRVSSTYLRRVEQTGIVPYSLALRLATLYGVGLGHFLRVRRGDGTRS